MGTACILTRQHMSDWSRHASTCRDEFESLLFAHLNNIEINGSRSHRLPHVTNIAVHGIDNESLLTMVPELVASTGSACHIADFAPSHVLLSLGKSPDVTQCSIRFGFGKDNTMEEARVAHKVLCDAVLRLSQSG